PRRHPWRHERSARRRPEGSPLGGAPKEVPLGERAGFQNGVRLPMKAVDAHQHFWAVSRGDYGWLTPALAPLYRDFGPDDFAPLARAAEVTRSIVVQAAPTVAETRYLLELARAH